MPTTPAFPLVRRILREPILHFLLLGVLLFVAYGKVAGPDRAGSRIVVSQAMVDAMAREYEARWIRKPGDQELAALVDAYVRDEILYREGLALGLDRDDALIKRRVRQKFEVIAEEQDGRDAPTDVELAAYVARHPDRFTLPATVSFEQVFIGGDGTKADVERAAATARAALARGADPGTLGRPSLLPRRVDAAPQDVVARDFGADFAARLATLPVGTWSGPLASGFGAHLVRVTAYEAAALPPLAAIRPSAARAWENERRESARGDGYRKLRANYTVVIEAKQGASVAAR